MEFAKELIAFNNRLQEAHKSTKMAKLWASAMRMIMSGNKTLNCTMENTNFAAHKVQNNNADDEEVKNAIEMLQESASDAKQAITKANDVLTTLKNNIEDLKDTEVHDDLRNEVLEILDPEQAEIKISYPNTKRELQCRSETSEITWVMQPLKTTFQRRSQKGSTLSICRSITAIKQ